MWYPIIGGILLGKKKWRSHDMKHFKLLLIFVLLLVTGCAQKEETPTMSEPVSQNKYLLGTIVNITLYDNLEQKIFDEIFAAIEKIEKEMTINNALNSEVIQINKHAGIDYVQVSDQTFEVIKTGLAYSKLGNGSFDITVGPLVKLWEIGFDNAHVPQEAEINERLTHIDYHKILLDEENHAVKLEDAGMQLDLGGIAKGYAADVAVSIITEHGNKAAIINLGGNVYAYGEKANGAPFKIGVQNPFSPRGDYLGILSVKNKTVVTSGTYERFFEQDGIIYHHILDPKTGYPVENDLESVTIVTDSSMSADALSTMTFVLGLEEGLKLVETLDNVEALFITKDYQLYASSGFLANFELTDDSFVIEQLNES